MKYVYDIVLASRGNTHVHAASKTYCTAHTHTHIYNERLKTHTHTHTLAYRVMCHHTACPISSSKHRSLEKSQTLWLLWRPHRLHSTTRQHTHTAHCVLGWWRMSQSYPAVGTLRTASIMYTTGHRGCRWIGSISFRCFPYRVAPTLSSPPSRLAGKPIHCHTLTHTHTEGKRSLHYGLLR